MSSSLLNTIKMDYRLRYLVNTLNEIIRFSEVVPNLVGTSVRIF